MVKDIKFVAISTKHPRWLEIAQGGYAGKGSWTPKPWEQKHQREEKNMIQKREAVENGTKGKWRDQVQRDGVLIQYLEPGLYV